MWVISEGLFLAPACLRRKVKCGCFTSPGGQITERSAVVHIVRLPGMLVLTTAALRRERWKNACLTPPLLPPYWACLWEVCCCSSTACDSSLIRCNVLQACAYDVPSWLSHGVRSRHLGSVCWRRH